MILEFKIVQTVRAAAGIEVRRARREIRHPCNIGYTVVIVIAAKNLRACNRPENNVWHIGVSKSIGRIETYISYQSRNVLHIGAHRLSPRENENASEEKKKNESI